MTMTREEAIKELYAWLDGCCGDEEIEPAREAFRMAIEALRSKIDWDLPISPLLKGKVHLATDKNVGTKDGRTIYRQAAIDALIKADYEFTGILSEPRARMFEQTINALPSAQQETAKRIVGKSRGGMTLWYQCDMCNEPVDAQDNFCRGCGRRLTNG